MPGLILSVSYCLKRLSDRIDNTCGYKDTCTLGNVFDINIIC